MKTPNLKLDLLSELLDYVAEEISTYSRETMGRRNVSEEEGGGCQL